MPMFILYQAYLSFVFYLFSPYALHSYFFIAFSLLYSWYYVLPFFHVSSTPAQRQLELSHSAGLQRQLSAS